MFLERIVFNFKFKVKTFIKFVDCSFTSKQTNEGKGEIEEEGRKIDEEGGINVGGG